MPVSGVTVLQRHDYQVTDPKAVLAAGRAAFLRDRPGAGDEAARSDVSHIGRAIYHVAHEAGWGSIGTTDGLRPRGGWIVAFAQDDIVGADPEAWPEDPFVETGPRLYSQADVHGT